MLRFTYDKDPYEVGEDELNKLLPHKASKNPPVIRSQTTESLRTKTNKGYEEHKIKLAMQTSNSSNDSLKRPPSHNTVTVSGLGGGAQVISSREFDQMRRNSQSIGKS